MCRPEGPALRLCPAQTRPSLWVANSSQGQPCPPQNPQANGTRPWQVSWHSLVSVQKPFMFPLSPTARESGGLLLVSAWEAKRGSPDAWDGENSLLLSPKAFPSQLMATSFRLLRPKPQSHSGPFSFPCPHSHQETTLAPPRK